MPFRALDYTFEVSGRARDAKRVSDLLIDLRVPDASAAEPDLLHIPELCDFDALIREINLRALRETRGQLLLHAAGLTRNGRTVALLGASGAGKTTLAAQMLLSGRWTYSSDEIVPVRRDGQVAAYPKPLTIKAESQVLHGKGSRLNGTSRHVPASLIAVVNTAPTSLHAVFVLTRQVSAKPQFRPLDEADRILALAQNSSYVLTIADPLAYLREVVATCSAWELTYESSEDAAAMIERLSL